LQDLPRFRITFLLGGASQKRPTRVGRRLNPMIAKPVRASDAACLTCHDDSVASVATRWSPARPVQLGDPLGVVLYGYQPR